MTSELAAVFRVASLEEPAPDFGPGMAADSMPVLVLRDTIHEIDASQCSGLTLRSAATLPIS
jgi:hypothetical protein